MRNVRLHPTAIKARTAATPDPGDTLAILLEKFITGLLDQAQVDGINGALSGATVRRLVARDLGETLVQWREDYGRILEMVGEDIP